MIVLAGNRGSGKTYDLVQLVLEDPDGVYLGATYRDSRWVASEYKLSKDQIGSYEELQNFPSKYLHKNLYIDNIKHGMKIPSEYIHRYNIEAVAVQGKNIMENMHLPIEYKRAILNQYKGMVQ